jgi:hypothetical protein
VVELLPQLLQCLWPLAQAWSNASQVCVYDTLFTCYRSFFQLKPSKPQTSNNSNRMTMVLSRTHADVAQLVQGQAADVLQHCVQQFARHGDETSRDTAMKMAQVFSAHASCSQIVLAFALSSISSAFQQAAAPSETCRCVLLMLMLMLMLMVLLMLYAIASSFPAMLQTLFL